MTVLEGIRTWPGAVTGPLAGPQARPMAFARRRLSTPVRAGRRAQPYGALLAVVLVSFLLGLIYIAQTLHVAATNYQIDQLIAERDDLARRVQTLETSVLRWGTEPAVLERAQRLGLDQLATRIRLPAR